jgi:hypothetical protein
MFRFCFGAAVIAIALLPNIANAQFCRSIDRSEARCEIQVDTLQRYLATATATHHTNSSRRGNAWVDLFIDGRRCAPRRSVQCDNCAPEVKADCTLDLQRGFHTLKATSGNEWMDADEVSIDLQWIDPRWDQVTRPKN